ncbi:hypothetical protein Q8W87_17515 [Pseudomonas aeruginosa]|uniref:hypothetical protein n=1 Tax=Pseudomonas aeruginosa TaxID=287 RepID=UPI002900F069|nr:hypothetical protein [Pseudomonas aeruginosa]MDU0701899.1 hypothetical protein [Pseudomonas aeruginosa]
MEINETRRKLIDIIAEHHATSPGIKLQIGELSTRAGISRQAFNRYYGDLKDYTLGVKPIGDLIDGATDERTKELLNQTQTSLRDLQQRMDSLAAEHERHLKKALDRYITSLMLDDVTAHSANDIRMTLEKQALHNLDLKRQLTNMELELARAKQSGIQSTSQPRSSTNLGDKIKIDIDLSKAIKEFEINKSEDDFEDKKEAALESALKKVSKIATDRKVKIILFAERYISRFELFFENFICQDDSLHLIVRTPIFFRSEFKIFINKLPLGHEISVYVPHLESTTDKKAQRAFYFGMIPAFELESADGADPIGLSVGIDKAVQFKVKRGD